MPAAGPQAQQTPMVDAFEPQRKSSLVAEHRTDLTREVDSPSSATIPSSSSTTVMLGGSDILSTCDIKDSSGFMLTL
jgi:hypothetical protein